VFGGTDEPDEIVVTGGKKVKSSSDGGGSGFAWVSLLSGGGGGGGGGGGTSLAEFALPEDWNLGSTIQLIYPQLVDTDGDGAVDSFEIVVTATAPSNPGSWYGGGWIAGLTGASVSGGGDQRHADWLLGLGGGYNIGYSADSDIATAYSDISPDGVIAPNVIMINGYPVIFQGIPAVSNIEFDPYTGTYGIGFGVGGAYAIKTIERNGSERNGSKR
jgi:hypothetical protein